MLNFMYYFIIRNRIVTPVKLKRNINVVTLQSIITKCIISKCFSINLNKQL